MTIPTINNLMGLLYTIPSLFKIPEVLLVLYGLDSFEYQLDDILKVILMHHFYSGMHVSQR